MNHEPLKPAPNWHFTSGAGWHDTTALVTRSHVDSPHSFVHGFEQGAYALAEVLYPLVWSANPDKRKEAMKILHSYHDGLAHPVRDWQHEPKRN